MPEKIENGNQVLLALSCRKCGHEKMLKNYVKANAKMIQHNPKQLVAVIGKEVQLDVLPTVRIECPRCGNNKAFAWQVQTRGSDESSTQFLRCTRCGFTFREYG